MNESLWQVAVDVPLFTAFTYSADDDLVSEAKESSLRGVVVDVPFGSRNSIGVVLGPSSSGADLKIKKISTVLGEFPRLDDRFLQWLEWLASHYMHPVGQVIQMAFPPIIKSKRKNSPKTHSKSQKLVSKETVIEPPKVLNQEQQVVFDSLAKQLTGFSVHLIYGVTGSGKTEIYLNLLERVIAAGKQSLVLVPEISLTPQLVRRFEARFGDEVAVIHSHLTKRERTDQWWSVVRGVRKILIGARSALFCPMKDLGLIIVDEEHETSFKQEEQLKYHARDAAIMLAKQMGCPILLGSATPSLESWENATKGRYQLHRLARRNDNQPLPRAHVVDLRAERVANKGARSNHRPFWMSRLLFEKIEERIGNSEQIALFLNRRGMAQSVFCGACGKTRECPNCAITLTLHGKSHLNCHYCDYTESFQDRCNYCSEAAVKPLGLGTELIEQDVRKYFPNLRIARADRDEIQTRGAMEQLIFQMERGHLDLLIGTQMIAKGLDFPRLTLVGLILADVGFHMPDFRASERSFQLITQMSGRAGRHRQASSGEVIIQTYNPQHESVVFSQRHDYEGFVSKELAQREVLAYPPYGRLAQIRIQGLNQNEVERVANLFFQRARQLQENRSNYEKVGLLGPCFAPLAKIRNRYRMHILFKGQSYSQLISFCTLLLGDRRWFGNKAKVMVDIDPYQML